MYYGYKERKTTIIHGNKCNPRKYWSIVTIINVDRELMLNKQIDDLRALTKSILNLDGVKQRFLETYKDGIFRVLYDRFIKGEL